MNISRLTDVLHRLATVPPGDVPLLSVYLDMHLPVAGAQPARRSGPIVLKERLHTIAQTLWPRGAAYDEFRSDADQVERLIQEHAATETSGLALFVSASRKLQVVFAATEPFANQVTFATLPSLFQLARLADHQETAVVVLADGETVRLFVTRFGFLTEIGEFHEASAHFRAHLAGGVGIKRYERHVAEHRQAFAREAASYLELLVQQEHAAQVILLGEERPLAVLQHALSSQVAALVRESPMRMEIEASDDRVAAAIAPVLAHVEAEHEQTTVERLIEALQAHGLGVTGVAATQAALEQGRVECLILDDAAPLDVTVREALTRQALATDAMVEVVTEHTILLHLEGVGALLRFDEALTC